jgi:hypothetical protein
MAEKIVSPGVFTRENDLSFLPQGISQIGAAIVGPTEKGPAFIPTLITTQAEYESIFGTPKDYYTGYAVQNYLRDAGAVTVVRVGGIGGYSQKGSLAVVANDVSTGVKQIVAVLAHSSSAQSASFTIANSTLVGAAEFGVFSITGSTSQYRMDMKKTSADSIDDVLGTSPSFNRDAYAYTYFDHTKTALSSSTIDGDVVFASDSETLSAQNFTADASNASTPYVQSQLYNGTTRYNLFRIHTIADGNTENVRFKVQISNIKSSNGSDYGTFSLVLRAFGDTDKRKSILEQYNNLTLDPSSPNFVGRRIGDRDVTIDSVGKITETGDYQNRSKFIRVEISTTTYPVTAIPYGHDKYELPVNCIAADSTDLTALFPIVTFTSASFSSSIFSSGFDFETAIVSDNNKNYLSPLPVGSGNGANYSFGLDNPKGVTSFSRYGLGLSAAETTDSTQVAMRNFTLAFQGGWDGIDPTITINKGEDISATNTQGFNCASSTTSGSVAYAKALNAVQNPDEYDINLLITPGIIRQYHPYVTTKAIDICQEREDVFYIADFAGAGATISEAVEQAAGEDSNYVGTYYPWIKTIDVNTNKLVAVPPSVLLAGTYAQNDRLGAEWFAPAGLNRGGIAGAVQVLNRLTQSERDTLYEGKVNPIATFPGQGISAFGQKTLQDKASALDRINVRRLLINLKKFVASTSRFLVFEQNTAQTRSKFLNTVNPYLEAVQQRQGLYAFRVVMDETNNTPDVIDRNILQGSVFLQPSKTAEFIVIDFNILPTGATFSV